MTGRRMELRRPGFNRSWLTMSRLNRSIVFTVIFVGGALVGSLILFAALSHEVVAGPDGWSPSDPEADRPMAMPPQQLHRSARLPEGFRVVGDDGDMGRVLLLRRPARSATALVRRALGDLAASFDRRPRVIGGVVDRQDRDVQALFAAQLGGASIRGLVVARVAGGQGALGILYDRAERLAASLRRLGGTLGGHWPRSTARPVSWQTVPLPDGSGTMRLPAGWRITSAYQGMVDARGPEGMGVSLGMAYQVFTPEGAQSPLGPSPYLLVAPYCDPVTALRVLGPQVARVSQAMGPPMPPMRWVRVIEQAPAPDVLPGGRAVFVHYEVDVGEGGGWRRYRCLSLLSTAPVSYARWMFSFSSVAAPVEVFGRNLPLLLEIWACWKVSGRVLRERLQKATQSLREAYRIYRQAHRRAQRVMENAMYDWAEVMRGTRAVEDTPTGERRPVDLGWVDEIVEQMNEREGWQRYRAIPLRELDRW